MTPGVKVLITAMVREEKFIIPAGDSVIEAGDYLFAVADATRVRELLRFFGKTTEPPRRVIIIGGGNTGLMLAGLIEKTGASPSNSSKRRRDKCEHLCRPPGRRPSSCTAMGRVRSSSKEEHIEETDFFIAVTNDEEANILGALLAKQLGARKVISLIRRIDYIPLVSPGGDRRGDQPPPRRHQPDPPFHPQGEDHLRHAASG